MKKNKNKNEFDIMYALLLATVDRCNPRLKKQKIFINNKEWQKINKMRDKHEG